MQLYVNTDRLRERFAMNNYEVLIVSRHPLLAAAVRHVAEKSGIGDIFQVETIREAVEIIETHRPATIIVDVSEDTPCEGVAAELLSKHGADCQVVCISLDTSDITVFTRQRISHANQSDLAAVLQRSLIGTLEELS